MQAARHQESGALQVSACPAWLRLAVGERQQARHQNLIHQHLHIEQSSISIPASLPNPSVQ